MTKRESFLNQLANKILDEQVSLFLGAGGSVDAGYPNWTDLFRPIAQELGLQIDEIKDHYSLAQYYSNVYGKAELRRKINELLNNNHCESTLLDQLIELDFSNIWTTNFDNALEKNFQNRNILINKIFNDIDFANININQRVNVFKMNGDITNLDNIIATQSEYEEYSDTHKIMLMYFKRALISSTFLFIGYSFTDHLVLQCLSEITRYLGESATHHFTIMKNQPENKEFQYFIEDLKKRYHIETLLVDEYSEITSVIKELNEKVRKKKIFISGSFTSYSDSNIENFSHSISNSLTTKLLKNDYRIVNGIGRRFGTHIIGYANAYLAKQGVKNIERYLHITAFVGNEANSAQVKYEQRLNTIKKCGAAIFVFGDNDGNSKDKTSGVWEEFQIACEQHKIIIPISYPETISEKIWEYIDQKITEFPYLEKVINLLKSNVDPEKITDAIIYILKSI